MTGPDAPVDGGGSGASLPPARMAPRPVREGLPAAAAAPELGVELSADERRWVITVRGSHQGTGGVPLAELCFTADDGSEERVTLSAFQNPEDLDPDRLLELFARARPPSSPEGADRS
ncbi:MAG: hypothetical protein R3E10_17260 [Gemmatimonadota bacterium]